MTESMNLRERFLATARFEPCTRTPRWELGYWAGAIQRWYGEGLTGTEQALRAEEPYGAWVGANNPSGRSFRGAENLLHAARVGREVLLHEHIHALLHGILEVGGAEAGMRSQHGDVARPQAVDRFAIGIEPLESTLFGHVDLVAEELAQGGV